MERQDEYQVRLEVFEGPLDLLLYLIKRDEVDIYDIPIEKITTQYMEYLGLMRMLDLNIAGEFIVMAATLMMIKSRMLLPVEERPDLDEDEEGDPRWDLVRQLVEYKKFKDAASFLEGLEMMRQNMFSSGSVVEAAELQKESALDIGDVSLFDLLSMFNEVLKRARKETVAEIFAARFTVADKIEAIIAAVHSSERVSFLALFDKMASRQEIATTFLALLELIRLRQVHVKQAADFAEIYIEKVSE